MSHLTKRKKTTRRRDTRKDRQSKQQRVAEGPAYTGKHVATLFDVTAVSKRTRSRITARNLHCPHPSIDCLLLYDIPGERFITTFDLEEMARETVGFDVKGTSFAFEVESKGNGWRCQVTFRGQRVTATFGHELMAEVPVSVGIRYSLQVNNVSRVPHYCTKYDARNAILFAVACRTRTLRKNLVSTAMGKRRKVIVNLRNAKQTDAVWAVLYRHGNTGRVYIAGKFEGKGKEWRRLGIL